MWVLLLNFPLQALGNEAGRPRSHPAAHSRHLRSVRAEQGLSSPPTQAHLPLVWTPALHISVTPYSKQTFPPPPQVPNTLLKANQNLLPAQETLKQTTPLQLEKKS